MCKGTTYGEKYSYYIPLEKFHKSIRHLYTKGIDVDKCIGKEVEYLLANGIATWGLSCCGHGKIHSQVWILQEHKEKAESLGYEVVEFDEDKTKIGVLVCLLKTGTQNAPVEYNGRIHED